MAARPVIVDTTRLLTRLKYAAPTGIDRVDLAYARHFLRGAYRGEAAAATLFGIRLMPERRVDALFAGVEARWSDRTDACDPVLADVAARLADEGRGPSPSGAGIGERQLSLAEIGREAGAFRWREAADAPRDSVYLHTSHVRLHQPELFAWLDRRPDIRAVFFVHDIIPIEYPEYAKPGQDARHRARMATVAQRAAAVIVSSRDVEARLSRYLAAEGLPVPPIQVAPIGVEPVFFSTSPEALSAKRPYFVVCGTIEARKNHLLLLQVWRDLAAQLGPRTPALVVVGRRGWESENVVDLLERCPAMHAHVIEAAGLSTPGLVALLRGARALLMPSFAEGYGIPVVEALSLGTPVIASDLPVHREIAGRHATFLHPIDGLGWRDAIMQTVKSDRGLGRSEFRPPAWSDHFTKIDALLATL